MPEDSHRHLLSDPTAWRAELDPQQWQAVSHPDGPVIVLAGAGSGKTRVLTYRIAYLLAQGTPPTAILALTFTNKAAETMRKRIEALVGDLAYGVSMGTFHSIFARWLRHELKGTPVRASFTIYDEEDSKAVVSAILKELNQDKKLTDPIRRIISFWKNQALDWSEVRPSTPTEALAQKIYPHYQARLRAAQALDFDDLLLETLRLFQQEPILRRYQERFRYLLVDEYQDTNPLQYQILRMLAQAHRNLFVVGDDAQSIYSFRGADIQNFRHLERDFAPVSIVRLEQNYRSTPEILRSANKLLETSSELYAKKLFTRNPSGPAPELHTDFLNSSEEAQFVVKKIRDLRMRYHLRWSDFAILYRVHSYSRPFEDQLRRERIPYRLVGGLSFYRREEVKHLLAFLRFVLNPEDEQALLRIVSVIGTGVGEGTLRHCQQLAGELGLSLWEAIPRALPQLRGPAQRALQALYQRLMLLRESVQGLPLPDAVEAILEMSGLLAYYQDSDQAQERLENLRDLVAAARDFAREVGPDASLGAFLEQAALASSVEDPEKGATDCVLLSTVHGVKGMEFTAVFLVGAAEGLFPLAASGREANTEEELRIFYVALTRAEKHLFLTCPRFDTRYGMRPMVVSRFVRQIGLAKEFSTPPAIRGLRPLPLNPHPISPSKSFSPQEATSPDQIQVGCRVEHTHFGVGIVRHREENGAAGVVQVEFDRVGLKRLDLRYAKFRLITDS